MKAEIQNAIAQAADVGASGQAARKAGDESTACRLFGEAHQLVADVVSRTFKNPLLPERFEAMQSAARWALENGDVTTSRKFWSEAFDLDSIAARSEEWDQLTDMTSWPDAWLIAAVRREPPDEKSLDTLVQRYWKSLFARCQLLTLSQEKAADLAQEAWCRVLRARHSLKPGGNFSGYITTIATNIWRDSHRLAKRAGPLAEARLVSLDAPISTEEGKAAVFVDMLPDLNTLEAEEQKILALDMDQALARLSPLLRDVLVSRLVLGESCAEIGQRYERTEQTVSGWVRQAIREMKRHLEEMDGTTVGETKHET